MSPERALFYCAEEKPISTEMVKAVENPGTFSAAESRSRKTLHKKPALRATFWQNDMKPEGEE